LPIEERTDDVTRHYYGPGTIANQINCAGDIVSKFKRRPNKDRHDRVSVEMGKIRRQTVE
jgi:hypothetical protein